jgi:sugar/nucleoside kinase (ribokinase family)
VRLLHIGNAVVDLVLPIERFPTSGGDIVAASSRLVAGGGVNVMLAATRQGLPVAYGGAHGTSPMGDLVRSTLHEAGVELLQPPTPGLDTGLVVALVEPSGERTFVTTVGTEANLGAEQLAQLEVRDDDLVYLSGYGLLPSATGEARSRWLADLPASVGVFFDPGPLGASIPSPVLDAVLARTDWFSANATESLALTGADDPAVAARILARRTGRRAVIVRTGAQGCLLIVDGGANDSVHLVAAPSVAAVDTSGAGDTHAGVFLAAIAAGLDAPAAAQRATVAAALSVTRPGPDTAPTAAEVEAFLEERGSGLGVGRSGSSTGP